MNRVGLRKDLRCHVESPVVEKAMTRTPLLVFLSWRTKGSSLRVEVQVGGRIRSSEVVASVCWADPEGGSGESVER